MNVLLLDGGAWPPGTAYAVAGYAVIFVTFFGYLGWMHLATRRLRRRLEDLERRVGRGRAA